MDDRRACSCEYEEIKIDKLIDFTIFQTSYGRINLEHADYIFIIKSHWENIRINNNVAMKLCKIVNFTISCCFYFSIYGEIMLVHS